MPAELERSVTYLKGVGPKRSELYQKLGISSVYDLLNHFPRDYIDYTATADIKSCPVNESRAVKGRVVKKLPPARIRKGLTVYKAIFTDDTADLTIIIYNSGFAFDKLSVGAEYILYGRITGNMVRKEINSPMFIPADSNEKIQPLYSLTDGLSQQLVRQAVRSALSSFDKKIYEPLPKWIMKENGLCSLDFAYENIHFPKDAHSLDIAKRRLVFDELLSLQLGMNLLRRKNRSRTGCVMHSVSLKRFYDSLPFELTEGQKAAIEDCAGDMCRDYPMNRLIQGDVGSGKTAAAAGAAYFAAANGYQIALMAPTEILSIQHYETLTGFFEKLGIKVCLLTGSLSAKQKKTLKEKIAFGEYQVIVGTHALVQQSTEFNNLGLVITDEQHRFGVEQRAMLAAKGENPHRLVMSATPIPRTLALMIYGDLDLSVLKELPKGRQPVETYAVTGKLRKRAFGFVKERLDEGRQGYIVCPAVEESELDVQSVKSYAEKLAAEDFRGYAIGLLHGRLPSAEKESVMQRFKDGEIDLLVSTTVVEVGVDVPNAAVMVIENSDRFGLSQLHQLRGRVGRGQHKSYCILITDNVTEEIRKRLRILSGTSDGFRISEEDLKLRGPGDFFGSRQHGLPRLKIADMSQDTDILLLAQKTAGLVTESDPDLEAPENKGLREAAQRLFSQKTSD
ncbi:ATP-dependent DNA helicase RecG [Ruminococcus sp. Marseille-P6503]|uniref:ATP-dependent DNA helicase RecG n=1 Tax=Ruminococcus sp. Marseille-P6503 TaxID=2364796 RepID=UPI000F51E25F|nr:ATP-dependent DNA helicase RecG [Ruminococcus sp. Marseille-P6503]